VSSYDMWAEMQERENDVDNERRRTLELALEEDRREKARAQRFVDECKQKGM
jgi:hypothetical protein